MKYAVVTFGCRVNQADSLALEAALVGRGAQAVSADRADVVVVNTCSVTASADQGARQMIRRIARENPAARIVATGCYATRCADEVRALPGVADVISNDAKEPQHLVARLFDRHGAPLNLDGPCGRMAPGLMGRTAWTLRVQTGCEEACSYCIIPTTRGRSRSRTPVDVHAEVERVIASSYKEIVLTGVHLGSYGRDLSPSGSLDVLLVDLMKIEHDVLFRISSLEPMDVPARLIDLAVASETRTQGARIAPHFHLPLQHASDRLLARMQRPYSLAEYRTQVDTIRQRLPHAAIGSDLIVGFPGETDGEFELLAAYLESSPLTHLHVFPYSDRPGTVASTLPDKVHGTVIKERAARLREISRRLQSRFHASQRGSIRPALTIDDGSAAITDNYFRVPVEPARERNSSVYVTV